MSDFVRRLLVEATAGYTRPDVSDFDSMSYIDEGGEGIVRDYGQFVVKKYESVDCTENTHFIKKIRGLIVNPDPDFIDFYDCWEGEDGIWYVAMQKLTYEQLQQPARDYAEAEKIIGDEFYDIIYDIEDTRPTEFPEALLPVNDNPYVQFIWYIRCSPKFLGVDMKTENMAVVNGKYKAFDIW